MPPRFGFEPPGESAMSARKLRRRANLLLTIAVSMGVASCQSAPQSARSSDILVRGGTLVDGTGAPPRLAAAPSTTSSPRTWRLLAAARP